jgi:hypothetical protein
MVPAPPDELLLPATLMTEPPVPCEVVPPVPFPLRVPSGVAQLPTLKSRGAASTSPAKNERFLGVARACIFTFELAIARVECSQPHTSWRYDAALNCRDLKMTLQGTPRANIKLSN